MSIFNRFSNLTSLIKKHQFLPVSFEVPCRFPGTDTEDTFNENLKKQSENWEYRNKKVEYTLNKQGYRAQDFKKIDWSNSIVVFGCSIAFGTGLTDEEFINQMPLWAKDIPFLKSDIIKFDRQYPKALDDEHPGTECYAQFAKSVFNEIQ